MREQPLHYYLSDGLPRFSDAVADIVDGWRQRALWSRLAWLDILLRYRGSVIGPFWLTLSMLIMLVAMGFIYGGIFQASREEYLPYLALGLIVWSLVSNLLLDSCVCFVKAEHLIKQVRLAHSVHVYRMLYRNLIIFAHNLPLYVGICLLFSLNPGLGVLGAVLGLVLVFINAQWVAILLGMLCARFRDIIPVVNSLVQVAFFVTPVIWLPDLLPVSRAWVYELNPFHHFIAIVRAPMLGQGMPLVSVGVALGLAVVGWAITLLFFRRFRRRLAYWI